GVSTAGGLVATSGLLELSSAEAAESPPRVLGPGPVPLELDINGTKRAVRAAPSATLAEVLRFDLDLTGTKIVCDRGECSACTIWLDGVPGCSCMPVALDVGAR